MTTKLPPRTNSAVVRRYLEGTGSANDVARAQKLIANYAMRKGWAKTWEDAAAGEYLRSMSKYHREQLIAQI